MKRLLLFLLSYGLVSVLAACSKPETVHTQNAQPPARVVKGDATIVDELLDKAGVNALITYLPTNVMKTTDDYLRRGIVQVDEVRNILNETYNPSALRTVVRAHLIDNLKEEQVKEMLSWLDTDLGKKVTALEVVGADPKKIHNILSQYHQLQNNQARVSMVHDLEVATGSAEQMIDMSLTLERSLQLALNQLLPESNQVSEAEFISREQEQRPQLQQRFNQYAEAIALYNYQNLNDDELNKYISFSQSNASQAYRREVSAALQKAVSSAGKKASLKIAALNAG
ncbi:hypothetical protein P886_0060 [Alteromonadaceae bacterium 2753L.S.0a.02]|nr:hypothetical protein P886_0060 [Alteromonadaceae bacterium 2753L.S.0a.02]